MNYLLFSGSLRTQSLNRKLIDVAKTILSKNPENRPIIADLKQLNMPVYDGDIETEGMPEGVKKMGELILSAHAIVISSPEYNGSIAGSLKNAIDWISRLRPIPLEKKPVLLLGASPGAFGTIRALGSARAPLEALQCFVYPQTLALPRAHEAFSSAGELLDAGTQKKLADLLENFSTFSKKLRTTSDSPVVTLSSALSQ